MSYSGVGGASIPAGRQHAGGVSANQERAKLLRLECVLGNGDGEWRPSHRPLRTPAHALSEMGSVGQRRDIYLTLLTAGS